MTGTVELEQDQPTGRMRFNVRTPEAASCRFVLTLLDARPKNRPSSSRRSGTPTGSSRWGKPSRSQPTATVQS
jgi:hypothetical protein